ncbi:hypothetical protein XhyaCFBP1156_16230 [Xanthomonas hyacinthi]|uniref:Integrase catalytic domain-containing protein n=1 Tax=Xanthomonas hyacinthi TaxID=56455 RepID=A0A2S7ESP7_9XANT|nr:hypothetical protein XhyaCFBP1156_16230 [Xanthomonas hyacinthi]
MGFQFKLSGVIQCRRAKRGLVEWATLTWVDWFNNRRLLEPIGNIPPTEAEANYYSHSPESVMSA